MSFAVVLDSSVLYPLPLRDTLLRVAEAELYDPRWSERILAEVARNLIADRRATQEQATRLLDAMRGALDAAAVPEEAIEQLEPAMTNHRDDRQVLAAAVASDAQAIVTLNIKHFPERACAPYAIEPLHPDTFLLDLHGLDPVAVVAAVHRQRPYFNDRPSSSSSCSTGSRTPCRPSPVLWLLGQRLDPRRSPIANTRSPRWACSGLQRPDWNDATTSTCGAGGVSSTSRDRDPWHPTDTGLGGRMFG